MTQIDQFESVFRSAAKDRFHYKEITFSKALLVTDLEQDETEAFAASVQSFVAVLEDQSKLAWTVLPKGSFASTDDLLALLQLHEPDLLCTYRNLGGTGWGRPHSLGEHLDVLTQCTEMPVLVLPHPESGYFSGDQAAKTDTVMAVTDHMIEDGGLINHAVHFTRKDGTLYLAHIEDQKTFDRYMNAISKIPTINTEEAQRRLADKLLAEPRDYIHTARAALADAGVSLTLEEYVAFGRQLEQYRTLIADKGVDLLVINAKDDDQLAMHGLAYPLAVELRHIPILML